MASSIVRIGTAGWSIPSANRERFSGAGSQLERYARVMNAVEINSSFYRPHKQKTYEKWARATPDNFRFAVKTPRQVTQFQHMRDPEAVLSRFGDEVSGLGAWCSDRSTAARSEVRRIRGGRILRRAQGKAACCHSLRAAASELVHARRRSVAEDKAHRPCRRRSDAYFRRRRTGRPARVDLYPPTRLAPDLLVGLHRALS